MNNSESINNLAKSYIAAQQSLGNVTKDKAGPNYKYADLPQVMEVIKAALLPHGLAFLQMVGRITDNKVSIENVLLHSSGETLSETAEIYIDAVLKNKYGKSIMSRTQRCGVAITYLRRKSALAFFAIGEEDYVDKAQVTHYEEPETVYLPPEKDNSEALVIKLADIIMLTPNPTETIEAILAKHKVQVLDDISVVDIQRWITAIEKRLAK